MKTKFYYILILFSLSCIQETIAQLNFTLNVDPRPSPQVLNWAANPSTVILTVNNNGLSSIDYKIGAYFKKDNNLVAEIDISSISIMTIDAFDTEVFFVEDVIPSNAVDILDPSIQSTVQRTGQFPAGNYQLCVELIDPNTQSILAQEQCAPFVLTSYQPPQLILPIDEAIILDRASISFMWSDIAPSYPTPVTYELNVYELLSNQSEVDAVRFNLPIISEYLISSNQFFWPLDVPLLDEETDFVWQVRALEDEFSGNPIGLNDGFSSIGKFSTPNLTAFEDSLLCDQVELRMDIVVEGEGVVKVTDISDSAPRDYNLNRRVIDFGEKDWSVDDSYFKREQYYTSGDKEICLKLFYGLDSDASKTFECQICETINIQVADCSAKIETKRNVISDTNFEVVLDSVWVPDSIMVMSKIWVVQNDTTIVGDTLKVIHDKGMSIDYCMEVVTYDQRTNEFCETKSCYQYNSNNQKCNEDNCSSLCNVTSMEVLDSASIIKICGGHQMVLNKKPSGTNSNLTGTGLIRVPWLNTDFNVTFKNISVNSDGYLCDGKILAKVDDDSPEFNEQYFKNLGVAWTKNKVRSLNNWLHSRRNLNKIKPIKKALSDVDLNEEAGKQAKPINLPLGAVNMKLNGDSTNLVTLAISEMRWTNSGAEMNVTIDFKVDAFASNNLAFAGTYIPFGLKGPFSDPQFGLELISEQSIQLTNHPDNDNYWMKFHKSGNGHRGNKFKFLGCEGNFCLDSDISFIFPRKTLLPKDSTKQNVEGNIQTQICDWSDWIAGVNIDDAYIPKTQEMEVQFKDIYYDHSDVSNPPSIKFPEGFNSDTSTLFQGFYAKNITVTLPDNYTTFEDPELKVKFGSKHLIIHHGQLSGQIFGHNIINYPLGNLADLGMSVDTFKLDILNNTVIGSTIKGKVQLPIVDEDVSNALDYEALWSNAGDTLNSQQFSISPRNGIRSALLGGPIFDIDSNSVVMYERYRDVLLDRDTSNFLADLNGRLNFDNINLNAGNGRQVPLDFELEFQGISAERNIIKSNGASQLDTMKADWGIWSFASPKKKALGFDFSMKNVKPITNPTVGSEIYNGGVNMDIYINLLPNKNESLSSISAETNINILGTVERPSKKCLKPRLHQVKVKDIIIDAQTSSIAIDGVLKLRDQDPVFGNGFLGQLNIDFKCLGLSTSGLVEFGNTHYNHIKPYKYFRAETDLILSHAAGINVWPSLKLRGFSGGFARNMEMIRKVENNEVSYEFKPKSGLLNLKAGVKFANSAKEETFNFDADLFAQFSNNNGIELLRLDTDFWVGAKMEAAAREKAKIKGGADVFYDFTTKHFNLTAKVDINKPKVLEANNQNLVLDINGSTNKWYFKFGTPQQLNTIKVLGKASLYEYFMFGNDIPMPSTFTNRFIAGYNSVFSGGSAGTPPDFADPALARVGRGVAMGLGIQIDKSGEFKKILKCKFDLIAGAEANLSFLEYNNCIGINNWRFAGSLGLYGKVGFKARALGVWYDLLDIRAGARISGQFPNPDYVYGVIDGQVRLLKRRNGNYRFNFSIHRDFERGTYCTPGSPSIGGPNAPAEDIAYDLQNLIRYIHPNSYGSIPTDKPFAVKYNLVPDEVFDLPENQGDGSTIMRTFKMVVNDDRQSKLVTKDDKTPLNIPYFRLDKQISPIGEHLLAIKAMTPIHLNDLSGAEPNPSLGLSGNPSTSSPTLSTGVITNQSQVGSLNVASISNGFNNLSNSFQQPMMGNIQVGPSFGAPGNQLVNLSTGAITPVIAQPSPQLAISDDFEFPEPLTNLLEANRLYELTLTAALKENINGVWTTAEDKNGNPITQKIVKTFSTGYIPMAANTQNPGSIQPEFTPTGNGNSTNPGSTLPTNVPASTVPASTIPAGQQLINPPGGLQPGGGF